MWNLKLFTEDVKNSSPKIQNIETNYEQLSNKLKTAGVLAKKTIIQELVCLMVWQYIAKFWQKISEKNSTVAISRPDFLPETENEVKDLEYRFLRKIFETSRSALEQNVLENLKKNFEIELNTLVQSAKTMAKSKTSELTETIGHHYKLYAEGSNPEIEKVKKQMEEVKNNSKLSQSEKNKKLEKLHNQLIKSGKKIDDNISNEVKRIYRSYLKSLNTYISRAQNELDVKKFSRKLAVNRLAKLRTMGSEDNLSTGAKAYFEELAGVNNRAHVENLSEFLSDTGRHSNFLKSVDPDAKLTVKLDGATVASNLRKKFGGGKVLTEKTEAAEKPETTGNVKNRTSLWEDKARATGKK